MSKGNILSKPTHAFYTGFLASLTICLILVFVVGPLFGFSKSFGGHGHDGYLELARNIIRGNGFVFEAGGSPALHRPPLYPLLISPLTLLPIHLQRSAIIIFQSLMVGGIAYFIHRLAEKWFSKATAQIAVLIFLFYPWVYMNAKNPMTAIIQGFFYILLIFLITKIISQYHSGQTDTDKTSRPFVDGISIGIVGAALSLCHGAMLAVVGIILLVIIVTSIVHKNHKLTTTVIIGGILTLVFISPWTYRNYKILGRLAPVTTNHGFSYFHSLLHWNITGADAKRKGESYEQAALRYLGIEGSSDEHTQFWGLKSPELDMKFNDAMKEHIRQEPIIFLKKVALNSVELYFPFLTSRFLAVKRFSWENLALTVFHLALWILAIFGLFRSGQIKGRRPKSLMVLALIILYGIWYIPIVTFIGHSLYTFATIPFLAILAANGLLSVANDSKRIPARRIIRR